MVLGGGKKFIKLGFCTWIIYWVVCNEDFIIGIGGVLMVFGMR